MHKYLSRYRKGSYELFEMSISEALRALEHIVGSQQFGGRKRASGVLTCWKCYGLWRSLKGNLEYAKDFGPCSEANEREIN
jgi:hypothetical protein